MLHKLNALKHGAFSKQWLLPGESAEVLEKLKEAVFDELRPEGVINSTVAEAVVATLRDLGRVDKIWGVFFAVHPIARMLEKSKGEVTAELESYVREQEEKLNALAHAATKIDKQDKRAQQAHKEDVNSLVIAMEKLLSLVLGIQHENNIALARRQELCAMLNRLLGQFYKNRDIRQADDILAAQKASATNGSKPERKPKGIPVAELLARKKTEAFDDDESFD